MWIRNSGAWLSRDWGSRWGDAQLAARLACEAGRLAQLGGLVRRHHAEAQPRGARRDGGGADALGEDTALEQPLAELHRRLRLAHPQRHDLALAAASLQPVSYTHLRAHETD